MRKWVMPGMGLLALGSVVGLAWAYSNGMCSSRARAEWEHGVALPPTAQYILCKGDAWGGFLDSGATTTFAMPTHELQSFLDGLDVMAVPDAPPAEPTPDAVRGILPVSSTMGRAAAAVMPHVVQTVTCRSPRGDRLHVSVWDLEQELLAVCMHTEWD